MGIETTPHNLQSENTLPSTFNLLIMSNLLKKFTDQLSGPNNQQNSSSSGGILHKVTDAVTGQKHPGQYSNHGGQQDYLGQQRYPEGQGNHGAQQAHGGYGADPGHGGYGGEQGHGGYVAQQGRGGY